MKIWADKEIVTNEDLNANFAQTGEDNTPTESDGYSATIAQMQSQVDPAPGGIESLATSLAGELERLRYVIARIAGEAYWYSPLDNDLAAGHPKHWGNTFQNIAAIADPVTPFTDSITYYAKSLGGGKAVFAYKNALGEVYTLQSVLAGDPEDPPNNPVLVGVSAQIGIVVTRPSPTTLRVKADRLTVRSNAVYGLDQVLSSGATGLNGLDQGTIAANTFYSLFVIYNKDTGQKGTLLSLSTPALVPAGFEARVIGGWRTDGSAQFVAGDLQDDTFTYARPIFLGRFTTGENVPFTVAPYAPSFLKRIHLIAQSDADKPAALRLHHTPMAGENWETVVAQVAWVVPTPPSELIVVKPTQDFHLLTGGGTDDTFYYTIPSSGVVTGGSSGIDIFVSGWTLAWRDP